MSARFIAFILPKVTSQATKSYMAKSTALHGKKHPRTLTKTLDSSKKILLRQFLNQIHSHKVKRKTNMNTPKQMMSTPRELNQLLADCSERQPQHWVRHHPVPEDRYCFQQLTGGQREGRRKLVGVCTISAPYIVPVWPT